MLFRGATNAKPSSTCRSSAHLRYHETLPPFASDRPIPHVLITSLALVAAAFAVVYWSIAGFA
jgi:hypothetical protein